MKLKFFRPISAYAANPRTSPPVASCTATGCVNDAALAHTPIAAPTILPRADTPRPHAMVATDARTLRVPTAASTTQPTTSNSALPHERSDALAAYAHGAEIVAAKNPASTKSTETCASRSLFMSLPDEAMVAIVNTPTGTIEKKSPKGAPFTSPKRSENPNATRKKNKQTNSWEPSAKNDEGCVMAISAGESED